MPIKVTLDKSIVFALTTTDQRSQNLIKSKEIIDFVHKFDILKDRLDNFHIKILTQSHVHFCDVVNLCLLLSHMNRRVESSLFSKRMVYEGIMKEGEIIKVDITNKIIDYIDRSHQLYQAAQKEMQRKPNTF